MRWLRANIRVRVVSKSYAGGRAYLGKGRVVDVPRVGEATVRMDLGELVLEGERRSGSRVPRFRVVQSWLRFCFDVCVAGEVAGLDRGVDMLASIGAGSHGSVDVVLGGVFARQWPRGR